MRSIEQIRQVEYDHARRFAEVKRAYEDALLRQAAYDALPWWRKAIWRVFGR